MRRTAAPAGESVSLGVILAWGGLALYLALFYLAPLKDVPAATGVLRRWQLWAPLFVPERIVPAWFDSFTTSALVQRAEIVAVAGSILAVAVALGWITLRLLCIDAKLTRLERFVFSAGVGLNAISTTVLVLGLFGVMQRGVFALLGAALILLAVGMWFRSKSVGQTTALDVSVPSDEAAASLGLEGKWLWLAVPLCLAMLGAAMLPPADFDVREYHLQAPKEFFLAQRIGFVPHNVYANMPLGTEMLSLLGMILCGDWWQGALVGKTLISVFAPLTALALFAAGRRWASPAAGAIAAVLYLSIPWVAIVSTQGLVEGAFGFYLWASLAAVLLATTGGKSPGLLLVAGYLSGGAVSCKYPAVVFSTLPLLVLVGCREAWRQVGGPSASQAAASRWRCVGVSLLAFAMACGAGCGPWFAKNAVLTGNPTYPLLYRVFDGATRTAEKDGQWTRAHSPPNFELSDLAARLADVTWRSAWLSPLVVPLAALALVAARRARMVLLLAGYLVFVFAAWWLFTHRIDRFWTPALPLAAMLAGIGATWSSARWWRTSVAVLVALGVAFDLIVMTSGQVIDNRYLADLDVLRGDPRLVEPWHRYLNEHAEEVSGVLLVGDAQPFDLVVPVEYNTVFDDCIFETLARGRTSQELHSALAAHRISHVLVSWSEIERYRSPGNYGITDFLQPEVFARLVEAGVLAKVPARETSGAELYRVTPLP